MEFNLKELQEELIISVYNTLEELISVESDFDDFESFRRFVFDDVENFKISFFEFMEDYLSERIVKLKGKFIFIDDMDEYFKHQGEILEVLKREL